jgi:hypothetical protein
MAGKTNERGRLSTFDLLIKIACSKGKKYFQSKKELI